MTDYPHTDIVDVLARRTPGHVGLDVQVSRRKDVTADELVEAAAAITAHLLQSSLAAPRHHMEVLNLTGARAAFLGSLDRYLDAGAEGTL